MNNLAPANTQQSTKENNANITQELQDALSVQRTAFAKETYPSLKTRLERLDRLHNAIVENKEALVEAVNADFGTRSRAETLLAEIYPTLEAIRMTRKRLRKWMKPSRRHTAITMMPAHVEVQYQPLGVVGIVVPWNFPIFLGLSPLVNVLSAGNSAMLKMSEFAPRTGELVKTMIANAFNEDEVTVFTGDVEVASAFTALPFDHMVFTGSTQVGKIVMRAAAENLTPVTLELGGKSPVIIHESFPVAEAAKRIAFGKSINAGQVCVSPDYILCPENKVDEFSQAFIEQMKTHFPTLLNNNDYTQIITQRQHDRLHSYLEDAKAKGAKIIQANASNEDVSGTRKFPMTVILNTTPDMRVMQEEIFGPLLPVLSYKTMDEAVQYVNDRDRPLALYYFDWDKQRGKDLLKRTHSGGVCINDTMNHVMADDIPFGGVGPSGMGHYHGKEGFLNFSKAKGVVRKGRIDITQLVGAPWDRPIFRLLMKFQSIKYRKRSI